jgi:hypothetical protein
VKGLIGQSIKIKPSCSLKPTLEIVVPWLICARLCDFVLSGGVETSEKPQDNCNGVHIARECNELSKLISVDINVLLLLEVLAGFEGHKHGGCLILWAED